MRQRLASMAAVIFLCAAASVSADFILDLETGLAWSGYNDVSIPGDTGTEFSLSDDLNSESEAFFRARAGYVFGGRHTVTALAAPLSVRYTGTLNRDVDFAGKTFSAGTDVEAVYRFNSYRLSYRWDFLQKKAFDAGIGLTGKIRDAEISLEGGGQTASKANVGFVPLVNFRFLLRPQDRVSIILEGDALAAPQGRAEDVLLAFAYEVSPRWNVRLGYRLLEGGADNDEVYNFALFHYTSLGIEGRF